MPPHQKQDMIAHNNKTKSTGTKSGGKTSFYIQLVARTSCILMMIHSILYFKSNILELIWIKKIVPFSFLFFGILGNHYMYYSNILSVVDTHIILIRPSGQNDKNTIFLNANKHIMYVVFPLCFLYNIRYQYPVILSDIYIHK